MGAEGDKVRLYTSQSVEVFNILKEQKACYVKREYIIKKYQEVSGVFLEGYNWYRTKAPNFVKKPEGAEYPYWAFTEAEYAGWYPESVLITLEVPVDEVVFFRIEDWNNILNLGYLPKDKKEGEHFDKLLENYGIKNKMDVFAKPFYPDLKQKVKKSWDNLFLYHNLAKDGTIERRHLQGGLWELKIDWVVDYSC